MMNPMEGEDFMFQIIFMPPPTMVSLIGFSLMGDVPADLSISPSGTISGTMKPYEDQMATMGMVSPGDAVIKENGENCQNNGRPKLEKFIFNFMVVYDTIIMPGTPPPIPLKEMSAVTITLLHNYTLDNQVFLDRYDGEITSETKTSLEKI
jgi:hypothetical protein